MSDFPPGFDYETLITDEDRELRKTVLAHYSDDATECILDKYMIAGTGNNQELCNNWMKYERQVRELIGRKLQEAEFIREIRQLNFKTPRLLY